MIIRRSTMWTALMTIVARATPAAGATTATLVGNASAALAFWIACGLVYLAIGVVLMAVATATALREDRAWASLLRWTAADEDTSPAGDGDGGRVSSSRAA